MSKEQDTECRSTSLETYTNQHMTFIQSNRMLNAKYPLTQTELKLLILFLTNIESEDTIFYLTSIPASVVFEKCGFNPRCGYSTLKEAAKKLITKAIMLEYPDEPSRFLYKTIFSSIEYRDGVINYRFSYDLREELLMLRRNFTMFDANIMLKLNGKYSIRLYQLLRQSLTVGKRKFSVDEIRFKLNIPKTRDSSKISRRILIPAVEEINASTDIYATIVPILERHTIVGWNFTIEQSLKTLACETWKQALEKTANSFSSFCVLPISELATILSGVPENYIEPYLTYAHKISERGVKDGRVKGNRKGYFMAILKNIVKSPDEAITDWEKDAEERESNLAWLSYGL